MQPRFVQPQVSTWPTMPRITRLGCTSTLMANGGTTTLTGTNTFAGTTAVSSGATLVNNGTANTAIANAGTFNNNASGTLSGGLANSGTVNANGGAINGAIANNGGGQFNVNGTVTSANVFTNAGGATLTVNNGGNYTVTGGIANNAGALITVKAGGMVTGALGNSGTVNNAGIYNADLNNTAGTITNLTGAGWHGNLLSNTGTVTNQTGATWTGTATNGAGGTLSNTGTWTGSVSNAGVFNNNAGGTVSAGLTNTAGIASNDGIINGSVIVNGGTLVGTGTLGNTQVNSGGTFAPGTPGAPGTAMTIAGNLAFQSGALYLLQLDPTSATRADVTGTATLAGNVLVTFAAGSYTSKQHIVLHSAGLGGTTFAAISTTSPNIKASLSYTTTDVLMDITATLGQGGAAPLPGNQQNVADTINRFFNNGGKMPPGFGTLFGLTGSNLSAALSHISGETATGSQQTTFNAMGLFMGLLTDPFIEGRGGSVTAGSSPGTVGYAAQDNPRDGTARDANAMFAKASPMADPFAQRWSVWAAGYGGSQTTDGNATLGSNNTTSSIFGTAVGADYRISPYTLAGFALAGGGTNFSVVNSGSGRSDLFQAGAFVRHNAGAAYLSGALAYGWQDITTDRTVTVAGLDRLRAEFNANTYSGRLEGGYRFVTPWIGGVGLTPYAAGQFTTFNLPGYAESVVSGTNTFTLVYGSKSVTDTRSELGVRADKSWAMPNAILTLRGRAAWAHDFSPDRAINSTFQALPGASFTVNGARQASESTLTTASVEMKWMNGWSAAGTFEGEFSDVTRSYAGKGVVRYAW
jgi:uncharacterized protein with beta-barrel porin domain